MAALMLSGDLNLWQKCLDVYPQVIKLLNDEKTKRKKGKQFEEEDTLIHLDNWYQDELPKIVSLRDPPYITSNELTKLMKWKLTRGKFRPRLTEMIKENSPETVMDITKKAFSLLPNLRKAIETLNSLRAVGPATASAILCIVSPEYAPFMSDESTQSLPELGQLNYSLKQYLQYAKTLTEQASKLGVTWNAHKVELALWSHTIANQLNPSLLSGDHDNDTLEQSSDSEETTPPKNKKQKVKQ